jgi:hypothetical protein
VYRHTDKVLLAVKIMQWSVLLSGRVSYHFSISAVTLWELIFALFGSTCYSWKSSSENLGSGVHFEACIGGTIWSCLGKVQDLGTWAL